MKIPITFKYDALFILSAAITLLLLDYLNYLEIANKFILIQLLIAYYLGKYLQKKELEEICS
ncbi:MAG: hypothetical protein CR982_05225 [Candidatus Cloacimonadota bacterium]|nr:MAG: hypothetical protein CR982_05225 [Candidatus Cloacimonadota bacterium]PIE77342.1 MAG: hypothetical protein CSA15_13480 [Candidatus Delongbacteria bacterium]